jgi:hypothetical protein
MRDIIEAIKNINSNKYNSIEEFKELCKIVFDINNSKSVTPEIKLDSNYLFKICNNNVLNTILLIHNLFPYRSDIRDIYINPILANKDYYVSNSDTINCINLEGLSDEFISETNLNRIILKRLTQFTKDTILDNTYALSFLQNIYKKVEQSLSYEDNTLFIDTLETISKYNINTMIRILKIIGVPDEDIITFLSDESSLSNPFNSKSELYKGSIDITEIHTLIKNNQTNKLVLKMCKTSAIYSLIENYNVLHPIQSIQYIKNSDNNNTSLYSTLYYLQVLILNHATISWDNNQLLIHITDKIIHDSIIEGCIEENYIPFTNKNLIFFDLYAANLNIFELPKSLNDVKKISNSLNKISDKETFKVLSIINAFKGQQGYKLHDIFNKSLKEGLDMHTLFDLLNKITVKTFIKQIERDIERDLSCDS